MKRGLSKSRLLSYQQCPKKLYLETNHRKLIHITPDQQKIFDMGHEVGALAQQRYPQGVLIENDFELHKAIDETTNQMANPDITTIFEATFTYKHVLIR